MTVAKANAIGVGHVQKHESQTNRREQTRLALPRQSKANQHKTGSLKWATTLESKPYKLKLSDTYENIR